MKKYYLFLLLLAGLPEATHAQRAGALMRGIRVTAPSFAGADSSNVRALKKSVGRNHVRGGIIGGALGLGIGAATGAIIGALTYHKRGSPETQGFLGCYFDCSAGAGALGGAIFGGGAGLIVGSVVGAIRGTEK